tara:strand:+ start:3492 stop:3953 length:462 start_codon:yes stop_codon:yes gene_type:complete
LRKAWFYINNLLNKGFTDEEILMKTRFHKGRYEMLKKVGTIPTIKEVSKLRSMMILSTKERRSSALDIWSSVDTRGQNRATEPEKEVTPLPVFTERQIEILKTLRGKDLPLARADATVAAHLRKRGLVSTKLNESNRRIYALTETGKLVAGGL